MSNAKQATRLDRFLRLFADVRAGEGTTALLLAFDVFLLLACYYIVKSVRDGLILAGSSAEIKSYTSAAQMLVLAVVVPLYGRLADRLPRRRLINVVTMFFAVSFVVWVAPLLLGWNIGVVFYVWVSIFGVMIIAQFWSFANDLYGKQEGERLFPIVAFGSSLGAVVGASYTSMVVGDLGIAPLLVIAALVLTAQVVITNYVDRRERSVKEADLPHEETTAIRPAAALISIGEVHDRLAAFQGTDDVPFDATFDDDLTQTTPETGRKDDVEDTGTGPFALVFATRYLLMIAALTMLLNFVNTTGGYILDRGISDAAASAFASGEGAGLGEEEFMGAFISARYSQFYAVVNLVGLLIQLFLVSRIVKYLGVAVGLMILPLIALGAYSLIAIYPVLSLIRWAKTAENATDYSLNNTVRNMLFLPTTREQKYKGKQVVDSFAQRAGDTFSALLVLVGAQILAMNLGVFAVVNLGAVAIWLFLAFLIGREYKRLVASGKPPS